jgi:hypothetical protein
MIYAHSFVLTVCANGGNLTSWGKTYKQSNTIILSTGVTKGPSLAFIEEEGWKPENPTESLTIKRTDVTDIEGFEVQLKNVAEVTMKMKDASGKTVGIVT